jgi:hypothetical protein
MNESPMPADRTMSPVFRAAWFRAGLALAGVGWLALVWSALCTVPGVPWNAPRLAASFALARGLPFYALRDSGAHLGWFYGPVFPIWYLPITLTDNPTLALVLAGVINLATILTPFALVLWAAGVARGWRLAAATLIAGVLLASDETNWAAYYFVHVDIVCLALGAGGCLALHRAATGGGRGWLPLAALGAVLAFWTKVIALPLAGAMLLWLWRERQGRLVGPLLFWLVVCGGVVSAVFFLWFGPEEILFNVWLIHSRNPRVGGWALLAEYAGNALRFAWVWLALLGWSWWDARRRPGSPLPAGAASLVRLLLWAALCQLPLGLLAPLKSGGTLGSLHSVWWCFLAAMIFLSHRWSQPATGASAARVFALAMLAATSMAQWHIWKFPGVWTLYRGQEADLAQARANPGKIYFPWNPLLTIISERRVYPLDDALYCLAVAGLEPPPDAIRAAVPDGAVLVYHENAQSHFAARYFPRAPGTHLKEAAP